MRKNIAHRGTGAATVWEGDFRVKIQLCTWGRQCLGTSCTGVSRPTGLAL